LLAKGKKVFSDGYSFACSLALEKGRKLITLIFDLLSFYLGQDFYEEGKKKISRFLNFNATIKEL
jgi:hypothetical protein